MDEQLLQREFKALDSLLRRYSSSWAVDRDHLDDLVQDVWAEAWRVRNQYRSCGTLAGWLLRICRTTCRRDTLRRRREAAAVSNLVMADAVPPERDDEARAHARDSMEDELLNRIVGLSPRQRSVLLLHYASGMSVGEIAMLLGRTRSTVKATIEQAKRRARGLPVRAGAKKTM